MGLPESVIRVVFVLDGPLLGTDGVVECSEALYELDGVMDVENGKHLKGDKLYWNITYSLHEGETDIKAVEAKLLSVIRGE